MFSLVITPLNSPDVNKSTVCFGYILTKYYLFTVGRVYESGLVSFGGQISKLNECDLELDIFHLSYEFYQAKMEIFN